MLRQLLKTSLLYIIPVCLVACGKSSSGYGGTSSGTYGGNNTTGTGSTVSISGMAFAPSSITVKVGTTVTWTNMDNMTHTVTDNNGGFNSGDMTNNKTFSFTFSKAGTFDYHCAYHSSMTGTVTVN